MEAQNEVLNIKSGISKYEVNDYLSIFIDKEAKSNIDQVSSPAFFNQFDKRYSQINQGFSSDIYWLKFTLKNTDSQPGIWWLAQSNISVNELTLYMPDSLKGHFNAKKSGLSYDVKGRDIPNRIPVFIINIPAHTEQTFYLQVKSSNTMTTPLTLWQPEKFIQEDRLETMILGLYYGFILVMIFYNLFLFISIKEYNYLFYILYITSFALFQFCDNGFAFEWFWSSISWWGNRCIPFFAGTSGLLGILFFTEFLNVKKKTVFWKILIGLASIGLLISLLSLANPILALKITPYYGIVMVISIGITIIAYLRKNSKAAVYILLAWLALLSGLLLLSMHTLGLVNANFFVVHGLQIGSALEVFLLSLALGNRINLLIEERTEAQVERQQMLQSKKFKEQYLAHISHEIRTPMNAIVGFARLLARSPLNVIQKNHVQNIQRSADNLLVIINDILDVTKIESGRMTFEQVEIHLPSLCNALVDTMQFKVAEKNINLRYHIDQTVPETIVGDPVRLNQILLNLLSNAVKFTDKGFVELSIKIIGEIDQNVTLQFDVEDTGIGIAKDRINAVFESYTQAGTDTTRKYGGTGLGLTIVKQLVELQGGKIEVTSELGEGSTFSVVMTFKSQSKEKSLVNTNVEPEVIEERNIPTAYILLLEDNPVNQTLAIQTICEFNPYIKIDTAENGKAGIEKLLENDYDLILMDVQMPIMDGYETTTYIRNKLPSNKKHIPIIGLTADVLQDNKDRALEAGMNDYIYKPFNASELFHKIDKLKVKSLNPSSEKAKFEVGAIRKTAMGNTEFMLELMNMFTDKTPDLLAEMKKFVKEKDWKSLSFIAHKNKMLFVVMGLNDLNKQLSEIEKAALQEENLDEMPGLVYIFSKKCKEIIRQISAEKGRLVNR